MNKRMKFFTQILAVCAIVFLMLLYEKGAARAQQTETVLWDEPIVVPSPEETSSWFPTFAVDHEGTAHLIWCETNHRDMNYSEPGDEVDRSTFESLYYAAWDGLRWTNPVDLVEPQQDIIRNSLTIDDQGMLHMLFDHSPNNGLFYTQAPASDAASAANWTEPIKVNAKNRTYFSDIESVGDVLHIVYDDEGEADGVCPGCSDIYYRRSSDRGETWSSVKSLAPTELGSANVQIEADEQGRLYVVWNEGWDRSSGTYTDERYGVYIHSPDGGTTWLPPKDFTLEAASVLQMTVEADGEGGVMIVWRSSARTQPGINYVWSSDYGASWTEPEAIPGIAAKVWGYEFDSYSMAMDSLGHIHLIASGYASRNLVAPRDYLAELSLFHMIWQDGSWSAPDPIYSGSWYPEYPQLIIHNGNQLHATWYIREEPFADRTPHQAMYASGEIASAPEITQVAPSTRQPTRTPSSTQTQAGATAIDGTPTPSVTSTPLADDGTNTSTAVSSESEYLVVLAKSVAPAAAAVLLLSLGYTWFKRRRY